MNPAIDTCLHLLMPQGLEETVSDVLLAHADLNLSFAAYPVQAHGGNVELVSASENVRGHAQRTHMEVLLSGEHATRLLDYLRAELPTPDIAYWLTPIQTYGRLA